MSSPSVASSVPAVPIEPASTSIGVEVGACSLIVPTIAVPAGKTVERTGECIVISVRSRRNKLEVRESRLTRRRNDDNLLLSAPTGGTGQLYDKKRKDEFVDFLDLLKTKVTYSSSAQLHATTNKNTQDCFEANKCNKRTDYRSESFDQHF
jgi:hypothetical protein